MDNFFCSFKFGYFVFVTVVAVYGQWRIEDCQTPNKVPGTCTSSYCKPMVDVLNNFPENIPREIRLFLKDFICGYDGKAPKVCCPSKPIVLPEVPGIPEASPNLPPNVDKHRNVNRLPTRDCGLIKVTDSIVYGNKTGVLEFPWMAMLWYKRGKDVGFGCGGTIINNRYILTAAHCITDDLVKVRIGDHDVRTEKDCQNGATGQICAPPYRDLIIEKRIIHEMYNTKTSKHDIALLRVPRIQFSDNMKPVCLPLNEARTYDVVGRYGVLAGWGTTESGNESPELQKAELPIIPLDTCQKKYNKLVTSKLYKEMATLINRQMCADASNLTNLCAGDSGGPLHVPMFLYNDVRYVQQGIVSLGPTRCGQINGLPGVYTKVVYYMPWILDNIEP